MRTPFLALMALLSFSFIAAAADVNGKYTGEVDMGRGPQTQTFNFKTTGAKVEGSQTTQRGDTPIEDGKIDGDTLTFTITRPGRNGGDPMKTSYTGKIKADGSIELSFQGRGGEMKITLKKS